MIIIITIIIIRRKKIMIIIMMMIVMMIMMMLKIMMMMMILMMMMMMMITITMIIMISSALHRRVTCPKGRDGLQCKAVRLFESLGHCIKYEVFNLVSLMPGFVLLNERANCPRTL